MAKRSQKRTKDRAETEARLKQAAADVFSAHGYDGASVKQVADSAGVNVSLINRYFGGKEGLFLSMIEELVQQKQGGELGYPPQPDLRSEIFEYLEFRLRADVANDQLTRILISKVAVDATFSKRVRKMLDSEVDKNLRARFFDLQSNGRIPADRDIDQLFRMISDYSFSANFLGYAVLGRSRRAIRRDFEAFARTCARGFIGNESRVV